MSNEKYEVSVNIAKKMVKITFSGKLECEDADGFFSLLEQCTRDVTKEEYIVLIDCGNMDIFKKEVLPYMLQGYNEYKKYKHVYVIYSTNIITNMQIKRIGREADIMNKVSFIEEENEIILV